MEIKVTRDLLDHYRKLKQEIPVLELELQMMKNTEAEDGVEIINDADEKAGQNIRDSNTEVPSGI